MPQLTSPGVAVSIVNESAYASPGTGTIPLIVLATQTDKSDPTGTYSDGIAAYTKKTKAGQVVPITSQRELTQFFGDAYFSEVEAAETSEYGLLATYSYLGQGSQAYVVRADIDLGQLEPSKVAPTGPVAGGSFWLDTDASKFGIHSFNGSVWVNRDPIVEVDMQASAGEVAGTYTPTAAVVTGGYLVAVLSDGSSVAVLYFEEVASAWAPLVTLDTTFAAHYDAPVSPTTADTWVKLTSAGNGIDLALYSADAAGEFGIVSMQGFSVDAGTTYLPQNGTSLTAIATLTDADSQMIVDSSAKLVALKTTISAAAADITTLFAQDEEPVGLPTDGTLWFNDDRTSIDVLVRASTGWERKANAEIFYSTEEPVAGMALGDVWIDTSAAARMRPMLYQYNGSAWLSHDNTDQTTQDGVLFDDFTFQTRTALPTGLITPITDAPNYLLYPEGMLAINMSLSGNTVRSYDATLAEWVNAAAPQADGSGSFGRYAQRKVIATAMQAAVSGNEDLRDPMRNFTLLVAPNFPELTDELITLNADRGETGFIIIDTPMRKTPTEAVAWVQGVGATENGDDGLVSKNTYSAVYYPAARGTSPSGVTVTVPASHAVLYTYAYNDNVAYPWFAPAGLTRGPVQNAGAVGYVTLEEEFKAVALTQGQRDAMYSNKMNPIATFPSEGVVVWGQKTLSPTASALDRVNVARLVAYLRERFDSIARPFLFEPNDKPTRERIQLVFASFLTDIMTKRGLTDFVVICDETNNTPARIDRNELYVDVAIEPMKAAEFIYIPIRIVNTGTL
jgi:hypothetical protein